MAVLRAAGHLVRLALGRMPRRLRHSLIDVLGLVALVAPVFLWISWSPTVFKAVLSIGLGALLALYLLIATSPDDMV